VAGVGNIYADEALFRARLHPARRACDLTGAEAERLRQSVVEVLNEAIQRRGSTIRDYVGGSGLMGGFQDEFRAYGRTGEPCPRCGTLIVSARLAGRSSHFCPSCQPPASVQRTAVSHQRKRRSEKGGRAAGQ
jgi:formamidopyrimidine-DNA glycosylase